jgi:folate-binding protein YgfZ
MSLSNEIQPLDRVAGSRELPDGDVLRLAGPDCLVALDRVVSQEVKSLRDGEGRLALLLAPKGQFRALMAVFRGAGEVVVLAPPGRGAEVAAQLRAYLRFNRVTLAALGWGGGLCLVAGAGWERAAAALGVEAGAVSASGSAVAGEPGDRLLLLGQTFLGTSGATIVPESAAAGERLRAALGAAGVEETSDAALELARITAGFPAWGRELTDTVLPPEVGLESVAISYTKGCYVGQETIARLKTYGHTNRTLVRLRQTGGSDLAPPLPLPLAAAGEEKPRGQLTSCERHPALGRVGLALVRRELALPGTTLSGASYSFRVVAPGDVATASVGRR